MLYNLSGFAMSEQILETVATFEQFVRDGNKSMTEAVEIHGVSLHCWAMPTCHIDVEDVHFSTSELSRAKIVPPAQNIINKRRFNEI